jgi:DNA-binding SARP family transcriptional activator
MATGLEFGILGPLEVRASGTLLHVGGPRQRALLGLLLCHANQVVSRDQLFEELLSDQPAEQAEPILRVQISRLRHVLADGDTEARLLARPPGYVLRVEPGELDLQLFEQRVAAGRDALARGDPAQAAALLGEAQSLWRGRPLADLEFESFARFEIQRLEAARLGAAEDRIEAELALGQHASLCPELELLVAEHPLRERLRGQLMVALYRSGRQAEALEAYRVGRALLVEQLGIEPGPGLRRMHEQVLAADAALDWPAPPAPGILAGQPPPAVVPRELPADVSAFTGREAELDELDLLIPDSTERGGGVAGAVVISAVAGTAGVGKTALAVHWAHKVTDRFPDGQLYVNLRGYDPGAPVRAADALAGFLRSLGVSGQDIPPEEDERAARYRSLIAGKQLLIVLDNAGSADQVRPLLPGSSSCTVLVTSRDTLAGLVARDGATRLDLDLLPPEDALALLRALIGARAAAEPAAANELAGQCCRLPLALRVAAELAVSRPDMSLAALAAELADLRTRLDLLDAGGDPGTRVRAVFSWSCRHLDPDAARTFRLVGLHPGPDLDPYAAAALTGTTMGQARQTLEVLARAYLIQPTEPGRYGMHDLLRGYARELSATTGGDREQHAALTRLFDHYLHTAAAAMDILFPAERHRRPRIPRPDTPVPPLPDPAAARHWLDREHAVLVAAAGHAAARDWPGHATRLATTLYRHLLSVGNYPEALTVFGHALAAARRTGDRAAEATALNEIGYVDWQQGRLQQSVDHFQQALALSRAAVDRAGEARALGNMGLAEKELGRYAEAARHHQDALTICRGIGDRHGEAMALGNVGLVRRMQGSYQEAAGYFQQALDLFRQIGDREGEAYALARLGVVDLQLANYQQAAGYLQQALALFHDMGHKVDEAEILLRLGGVDVELGRYEHAAASFEQALAVFREIGDPVLEAGALNGLGDLFCRTGQTGKARAHHAAALRLASQADSPLQQAHAHDGLARASDADGDTPQARHHWQQALTRYTAIGDPQASQIRAHLAKAGDSGDDDDNPGQQNAGLGAKKG